MGYQDAKNRLKERLVEYMALVHPEIKRLSSFRSPWREDKHPSCSLCTRTNRIRDYGTGQSFDVFDVAGLDFELEAFRDKVAAVCKVLREPEPTYELTKTPLRDENKGSNTHNARMINRVLQANLGAGGAMFGAFNLFEVAQAANAELTRHEYALEYLFSLGLGIHEIAYNLIGYTDHPEQIIPGARVHSHGDSGFITLPFLRADKGPHDVIQDTVQTFAFIPLEGKAREFSIRHVPIYRGYRLFKPGVLYITQTVIGALILEAKRKGARACALCGNDLGIVERIPASHRPALILTSKR